MMYPFSLRGASTSFLVVLGLLWGCSGSSSPPPKTLPLDSIALDDNPQCDRVTGHDRGVILYRCESVGGPVYVTTLKDCSIPEKFTFQATTRQLLVGVMDLKVENQQPVQFSDVKALHSVVSGTMDADPFLMSIFTFHESTCITDLVLWRGRKPEKPSAEDTSNFGNLTSKLAERLVPKLVLVEDLARAGN
jgi:hypothetical protein